MQTKSFETMFRKSNGDVVFLNFSETPLMQYIQDMGSEGWEYKGVLPKSQSEELHSIIVFQREKQPSGYEA